MFNMLSIPHNHPDKVKMKRSKTLICILTIALSTACLTGCLKKVDKNKEAVQIVVKQMLNAPDKEMVKLWDDMWKSYDDAVQKQSISSNNIQTLQIETEFDKKLKEMYSPYFTEEEYTRNIQIAGFTEYNLYCEEKKYTIEVDKIDVNQNKKQNNNYDFVAHVVYGPVDGQKTKLDVVGTAQFGEEEGKISYLQIFAKELIREFQK